ncbi:MAG: protoheme IX farnesyltransferase [Acidobacteria bacterium]|nr:protoheme IX farnesyltransferase [Acidobacteriota bacterium]
MSTETMPAVAGPAASSRAEDFLELTKPRITVLVVITTLVAFYLASPELLSPTLLVHTLFGTALVAAGASALNMYMERHLDARMRRTSRRPLPTGRLQPEEALAFALAIAVAGIVYLFVLVNALTSLLSAVTLASYLLLYTPLKTRTWLCTLIGAAPGALPVIMGWAAATGALSTGGWILFAIVFLWQIPHFYAIGWLYREDYERAGFPMLPVLDPGGLRTSRQINFFILILLAASLLPLPMRMTGIGYAAGAAILGLVFLFFGIAFSRRREGGRARRLFVYSIVYLPALMALLMIDKAGI